MLAKPTLVLLLLVATFNWTSANPVRSARSPKKVVDYKVDIRETGTQYNETIEIDTEKQTELFKVPAHNDVDESNILHDFKTNMTMMLLPEKKICYLMPLSEDVPTPERLESDLDQTENLSLLLKPEKKNCYLLPLENGLSPPAKLASDMDKAEVGTSSS
ncbi:uncharacterized protein LOC111333280 [Stylophora pistillata]|uniref:uncharacterized protein LOC111333280 n=1 Tax=Stylophora pistillata TaxID=50429 RepID=UPI000C03BBB1|nr:uncharacterized protein LOC111333280 [Stylophora pistillata]